MAEQITQEIEQWPVVTSAPHRFVGIEFRFNHREICHLHGDRQADLPFPTRIRSDLVASGRAQPHHVLPDSGWVSVRIRSADDVPGVLELFRMNYERLAAVGQSARDPEQEVTTRGG
ncbi:MAG: luciferase family protein [bacterium]